MVAQITHAQAGSFGQFLLGQPDCKPVIPEERAKGWMLIRHDM
jgi:hypothetical protein